MSRASESRLHFSGHKPDSGPGSLSPARPRRKQTRTAARSDRPTRTASPLKAPLGQKSAPLPSEGGSPEREAGLRLKTASELKRAPPSRGRFCSLDRVESKREPMAFVRARARFRSGVAFARSRSKREPAPAQIGQPEGGSPRREAGLRLRTAMEAGLSCRKAGPPTAHINILQISRHFSAPRIFAQPKKEFVSGRVRPLSAKSGPMTVLSTKKLSAGGQTVSGQKAAQGQLHQIRATLADSIVTPTVLSKASFNGRFLKANGHP